MAFCMFACDLMLPLYRHIVTLLVTVFNFIAACQRSFLTVKQPLGH